MQVVADLKVGMDQIVQWDGDLFPVRLIALAQPNCYRNDGSVEPSIFGGVIIMPMLRRIILEVVNYEFIFSQLSGVL